MEVNLLVHKSASINDQGLSCDKIAFIASEEYDRSNQILRLLKSAEWCATYIILCNIIDYRPTRFSVCETRC